jgi:hypothetical protein
MTHRDFNFRSFTSFILAWAFPVLVISGAVLYVAPPGRIANWVRWELLLLSKEQWQAVHTLTAILFLTGSLFHLLKFNWKQFAAYLRKRREGGRPVRYELAASLVLFLLVVAGTIARQAPFQTVMNAGESLRESWEPAGNNPPIPHMEEMTMAQFSENLRIETPRLMQSLDQLGWKPAGEDERLRELALRNGRSPEQIYGALMAKFNAAAKSPGERGPMAVTEPGSGWGRGQGFRLLAEIAAENGLTAEEAVRRLAARGIAAGPQDSIRDIMGRSGKKPYEVLEIIKVKVD